VQNPSDETADELKAYANTDKQIWRATDSYYAPSIHVTEQGGIGINVDGHVIVMPVEKWHALGRTFLDDHHHPAA
jgi:hypothetical protein